MLEIPGAGDCDVGPVELQRCDVRDIEILKILSRVGLRCVARRALGGVWFGASRCAVCVAGARKPHYDALRLAWFVVCCFVRSRESRERWRERKYKGVDDISPRRDFLHGVAECFLIFRRATGGELTAPRRAEKRPTFLM